MARQRIKFSRVSSEDQTKNWSLSAQEKTIRDYCSAKGWVLVEIYADEGHSAWGEKSELRPEYLRMMGQVPGRGVRVRHPDCTAQAAADCVSGASCSASCFVVTPGVR